MNIIKDFLLLYSKKLVNFACFVFFVFKKILSSSPYKISCKERKERIVTFNPPRLGASA